MDGLEPVQFSLPTLFAPPSQPPTGLLNCWALVSLVGTHTVTPSNRLTYIPLTNLQG